MVKTILNNKNIEYRYNLINDYNEEDRNDFMNMAKKAGQMSFPIIIKNKKIITLQEID